jgi:TonB family protein
MAPKQARVQGDVILELEISSQGSVTNVKIVRNIPLLGNAAAAAAREWVYEPTPQNGTPVSRTLTVTEHFALPVAARKKQ